MVVTSLLLICGIIASLVRKKEVKCESWVKRASARLPLHESSESWVKGTSHRAGHRAGGQSRWSGPISQPVPVIARGDSPSDRNRPHCIHPYCIQARAQITEGCTCHGHSCNWKYLPHVAVPLVEYGLRLVAFAGQRIQKWRYRRHWKHISPSSANRLEA